MRKRLRLPSRHKFSGPASLWKRFLAFITDLLLLNIIILAPFRPVIEKIVPLNQTYNEIYKFISTNKEYTNLLFILIFAIGIILILYFALMEYKLNQTVGKMLFKIKVKSKNKKLKFWQCILRSLFLLPIFPFFILWFLDPIWILFNSDKQRLTEVLSKTMVVETYTL